jgi:hypothetical protein
MPSPRPASESEEQQASTKPETQPHQEASTAAIGTKLVDEPTAGSKVETENAAGPETGTDDHATHGKSARSAGGSYTDDDREARLQAMIAKKKEIEQKIQNALTLEVSPEIELNNDGARTGEFRTDDPYRDAALKYEQKHDRYPIAKSTTQWGHDIDSYTHPILHPERKLIRRIEVKGRGVKWDSTEIVEMSDTQFCDALTRAVNAGEQIDNDFDYWLYVVETDANGELNVLPIRNVAKRAAHFALKGGSWRNEAEQHDSSKGVPPAHAVTSAKSADTNG